MTEHNPELWNFPCTIALKVVGDAHEQFENEVIMAVQSVKPGDYRSKSMPSKNGKFVSITVPVIVTDIDEVQALFAAARRVAGVHIVL